MATLPVDFHHMFDIDPDRTRQLATVRGSALKRWAFAQSSSDDFFRDISYAAYAYGQSPENLQSQGFLLPYTTRLTESRRFSVVEYLSHLRLVPSLKGVYAYLRRTGRNIMRRLRYAAPAKRAASPSLNRQSIAAIDAEK